VNLLEYGTRSLVGGETIHAVYGGLHISPFDDWDEKRDAAIKSLAGFGVQRLGCNHCTGQMAVRKMLEAGLPVVRGTARHGSKTDLFLGNGDALEIEGS
jgi:7,8-dihydropterin-6-yl-methyl-4-(beta-D-ribofuranosyl)aminobenzene 5'-phosphate synthase